MQRRAVIRTWFAVLGGAACVRRRGSDSSAAPGLAAGALVLPWDRWTAVAFPVIEPPSVCCVVCFRCPFVVDPPRVVLEAWSVGGSCCCCDVACCAVTQCGLREMLQSLHTLPAQSESE